MTHAEESPPGVCSKQGLPPKSTVERKNFSIAVVLFPEQELSHKIHISSKLVGFAFVIVPS